MTYAVAGAKRWVISAGLSAATLLGCGDGMAPEPAAGGRVAVDPIAGDQTPVEPIEPIEPVDVGHPISVISTPDAEPAAETQLEPHEAWSPRWSGAGQAPEEFPVEEAVFDMLRDLLEAEAREDLRYLIPWLVGAGPCKDCRWGARLREHFGDRLGDMPDDVRLTLERDGDGPEARLELSDRAVVCHTDGGCAIIVEVDTISGEGAIERMAGSLDRVSWRLSFVDEQSDPPSSHSWTLDLMPLGTDGRVDGHAVEVRGVERPDATGDEARPSRPHGADGIDRPDTPTLGTDR